MCIGSFDKNGEEREEKKEERRRKEGNEEREGDEEDLKFHRAVGRSIS